MNTPVESEQSQSRVGYNGASRGHISSLPYTEENNRRNSSNVNLSISQFIFPIKTEALPRNEPNDNIIKWPTNHLPPELAEDKGAAKHQYSTNTPTSMPTKSIIENQYTDNLDKSPPDDQSMDSNISTPCMTVKEELADEQIFSAVSMLCNCLQN